jgi:hypothetical protein
MRVIGSGKAVVEMLRDFGLSGYESRVYFTLLTLGETKASTIMKKAYVPQWKAYARATRYTVLYLPLIYFLYVPKLR